MPQLQEQPRPVIRQLLDYPQQIPLQQTIKENLLQACQGGKLLSCLPKRKKGNGHSTMHQLVLPKCT